MCVSILQKTPSWLLPLVADDYPYILANPSHILSPQLSMDRASHLEDSAETSPVRQISRLSLTGDWDKVSAFAEAGGGLSGPPTLHRTSTFPKPASGKLEKGAWLRQRPGATLFEILQASPLCRHCTTHTANACRQGYLCSMMVWSVALPVREKGDCAGQLTVDRGSASLEVC